MVLIGVAATVAIAAIHPLYDSFWERWGSAIADSLVVIGVFIEIRFSQLAGLRHGELKRRSDERVAEANQSAAQAIKDAAEARERTAEVERLTAWRRVNRKFKEKIVAAFAQKPLRILIEYQTGDPEAFSFARDFAELFSELGN